MLSCESFKLFKNTYFLEDLRTVCSETRLRRSFFKDVARLTARKLLAKKESVRKRVSHRYFSGLFIKPGIQEQGMEYGDLWGMFNRIPRDVTILTFRGILKQIPGNVVEDSEEY